MVSAFTRYLVWIPGMLALLSGCEDRERSQARVLLERLDAIEVEDPPDVRRGKVSALEQLNLADDELERVRDVCAQAHGALLRAEQEQTDAKQALERAQRDDTPPLENRQAFAIADAIERSTKRLRQAQDAFPQCHRARRELAMRFTKRR